MKPISVQDYLANPAKTVVPDVGVVFGDDHFLKTQAAQTLREQVLQGEDAEFSFSRHEGKSALLEVVLKELATQSMFGGGRRFVLVEDADPFITKYRAELEDYIGKMSQAKNSHANAALLLLLKTLASNTKLYKMLAESGLLIDAKPLEERSVPAWIGRWGKQRHRLQVNADAAEEMLRRVGPDSGMLDQELAKLALMVPDGAATGGVTTGKAGTVTLELVEKNVGSLWAQSIFQMLDAALFGQTAEALRLLDRLLISGEKAFTILNRISPTLRNFATATEKILEYEKRGQRVSLQTVLSDSGVWRSVLDKSEKQLRTLGRHRGLKLRDMLFQADLNLKGGSKMNERLILETLIVNLSAPELRASPRPATK